MSTPVRIYGSGSIEIPGHVIQRGTPLTKLVLQVGAEKVRDEQGVDSLTRRYFIRKDLAEANQPNKGDCDFRWRHLRVIDWVVIENAVNAEIRVRYNGLPRGFAPIYIPKYGTKLTTATLYGALGSMTLQYYAPTLVRNWSSPVQPKWKDSFKLKEFDRPLHIKGFRAPNGIRLKGDGIDFLAKYFKFTVETVRTAVDTPEDGWCVRVSETFERQIVQESELRFSYLLTALGK